MKPKNDNDVLCYSEYGNSFVAGIQKDNITGVQFHPEKSHKYGTQFFKNYFDLR
jgi:glutamine amidotransferase